ncbi:MAG TPA: hypothetical protein VFE88_01795 [Candidatus Nanoarchaeia archaeon]|nr:hypothetical protein [Candidatus Nanoarchaeia archaeon]
MARQLTRKENILGLLGCIVVDTSDIGSLLTKVAKDLQNGELEEARTKLGVLGSIYDNVPGCAFFRSTECNYFHYLGLRRAYEEQVKVQPGK